jgi:hypothetical protein
MVMAVMIRDQAVHTTNRGHSFDYEKKNSSQTYRTMEQLPLEVSHDGSTSSNSPHQQRIAPRQNHNVS